MRKVVAISGAAAVALATAAGYATYSSAHGSADRDVTTIPALVTPQDAVQPREGRDFTVVRTLRGRDAREATGITASGEVLLTGYSGFHDVLQNTLLDPVTGRRTRLHDSRTVLEATSRSVTFVRATFRKHPPVLVRLDRTTGQERVFTLPVVPGRQYYTVVGLDRSTVWFTNGTNLNFAGPEPLWTVRFGHPATLEQHGRRSSPTVTDGVLAWVERSQAGPDVVAMREASGGAVSRATLPEDCTVAPDRAGFMTNGSQWVADTFCSARSGGPAGPAQERRSQPTFVLDPAVGVVTELRVESDEGATQLSDRAVEYYRYYFDLTTGTLYDLGAVPDFGGTPAAVGPGDHPLAMWPRDPDTQGVPGRVLIVRLS